MIYFMKIKFLITNYDFFCHKLHEFARKNLYTDIYRLLFTKKS
jgi:hypothetical protein